MVGKCNTPLYFLLLRVPCEVLLIFQVRDTEAQVTSSPAQSYAGQSKARIDNQAWECLALKPIYTWCLSHTASEQTNRTGGGVGGLVGRCCRLCLGH